MKNNFISRNHPFLGTYIGDFDNFSAVISVPANGIFRLITQSIVISWNLLIKFDKKPTTLFQGITHFWAPTLVISVSSAQ